ncbi:unnamed protein product, partial [Meganyctiphanes norvegica]
TSHAPLGQGTRFVDRVPRCHDDATLTPPHPSNLDGRSGSTALNQPQAYMGTHGLYGSTTFGMQPQWSPFWPVMSNQMFPPQMMHPNILLPQMMHPPMAQPQMVHPQYMMQMGQWGPPPATSFQVLAKICSDKFECEQNYIPESHKLFKTEGDTKS